MHHYTRLDAPFGPVRLVTDGTALTGLYFEGHAPALGDDWLRDDEMPILREARRQLLAYCEGRLREFDLPLAPRGTAFQLAVWNALRTIPYGETISYGELAARVGNPRGSRAVGMANNRNPLAVIVPCHRVVGHDGKLVGYGGGLPLKQWLLQLERNAVSASPVGAGA